MVISHACTQFFCFALTLEHVQNELALPLRIVHEISQTHFRRQKAAQRKCLLSKSSFVMTFSLLPLMCCMCFWSKFFVGTLFFWAGKTRLIGCVGSEGYHLERHLKTFLTLLRAQKNAFLVTGDFSDTKERIQRSNVHKMKVNSNNTYNGTSQTIAKLPVKNLTGEYKKLKTTHHKHLQKMCHIIKKSSSVFRCFCRSWNGALLEFFRKKGPFFQSSLLIKCEYPNYETSLRRCFTITTATTTRARRAHCAFAFQSTAPSSSYSVTSTYTVLYMYACAYAHDIVPDH